MKNPLDLQYGDELDEYKARVEMEADRLEYLARDAVTAIMALKTLNSDSARFPEDVAHRLAIAEVDAKRIDHIYTERAENARSILNTLNNIETDEDFNIYRQGRLAVAAQKAGIQVPAGGFPPVGPKSSSPSSSGNVSDPGYGAYL